MKTRKQILVLSFIALSLILSVPAQAGLRDWFRSNSAQAEQSKNGSFEALVASMLDGSTSNTSNQVSLAGNAVVPVNSPTGGSSKVIRKTYLVELSAYTSEVAQTDDSPFITAKGTHVRDGIVATNMFPFGTTLKIPSLYGDKIFVVEDRMNTRYQNNVDIWFDDKPAALKLGRRLVQIEVIK